jgi:hypothetical protein
MTYAQQAVGTVWRRISKEMGVGKTTVRRIYQEAIAGVSEGGEGIGGVRRVNMDERD